jgi:hypothetical protein
MRSWSLELAVLTIVVTAFAAPAAASGKLALRGHRVHGLAGGSSGANCTRTEYNGGALIPQVKIVVVQWGGASSYASQLAGFYSGMLQSPYMDWLREYDEPSYSIVRGDSPACSSIRRRRARPPSTTSMTSSRSSSDWSPRARCRRPTQTRST